MLLDRSGVAADGERECHAQQNQCQAINRWWDKMCGYAIQWLSFLAS
jgi:hypothetical protein